MTCATEHQISDRNVVPVSTHGLRSALVGVAAWAVLGAIAAAGESPIELGQRRELFVDRFLIQSMNGLTLNLCEPRDEGVVLRFDAPWEGPFCGYCTVIHDTVIHDTVIHDGPQYRVYYRGKPSTAPDGHDEVTCLAESSDGIHWTKPKLGLIDVAGSRENNVVLAADHLSHNFSPLLDARPGVRDDERYKALGGTMETGLLAFASADGKAWRKLRDQPVLAKSEVPFPYMFDSQNLAFWSPTEGKYVAYFRVFQDKVRRIARAESENFLDWSAVTLMDYRDADGGSAPIEHLYTNQTHPYFRAPHLGVSIAARFMPRRQVLTTEEAQAIHVDPKYFRDTSDAIFMTTRGGRYYDRVFLSSFIRPGIGAQNWVSRTNYPALNLVQTSPTEMSVYVNQDYAQPTAHLRRYSLRLDGFASLRAPYSGGEMVTRPLTFTGNRLLLNFSTSAAGGIRIEVQDAAGRPLPGFTLADSVETIGNEIDRPARWRDNPDLEKLAGQTVRLRLVMKDADLFAFRFDRGK